MLNKRVKKDRIREKTGIIQKHLNNNLKNYAIVTVIFLVRCNIRRAIHKQHK